MQIAPTAATPRRDYHVVFESRSMLWAVRRENSPEVWHYAVTKAEAIGTGMTQAREGAVSLIVHGQNGKIQTVYSYDNWTDPWS